MILPTNRKIVFGLILAGIVIVISMFDTIFELVLEQIHFFHTDLHATQIIVFYLLLFTLRGSHCTNCTNSCAACLDGIAKLKKILPFVGLSLKKRF
jgi:hypothetical protein